VNGPFDAVAFDLGGVLIDWNPRYLYRSVFPDEVSMERFLAEICTPAWNHRMDGGRPFAEAIVELSETHPDYARQIEMWLSRWDEMLGGPFDDVVEIMRELKRAGIKVYALSNWSAETFPRARARYRFLGEFDGIVVSGEVGTAKPEAAIFRLFLERFGLEPGRVVFLDDMPANVVAAREAGIEAIDFQNATGLRARLAELGLPVEPHRV
jgi:2-haloacid dehalogenase